MGKNPCKSLAWWCVLRGIYHVHYSWKFITHLAFFSHMHFSHVFLIYTVLALLWICIYSFPCIHRYTYELIYVTNITWILRSLLFFLYVLFCVYYLLLCNKLPPKYRDLIQLSFVLCHLFSVYQEFKNKVAC